jgi:hypothetical protein
MKQYRDYLQTRMKSPPPVKKPSVKKTSEKKPKVSPPKAGSPIRSPSKSPAKASPPKRVIKQSELIQEFRTCALIYKSQEIEPLTLFQPSVWNVWVEEHPKFYGLIGGDLLYIKSMIPKNGTKNPLYNRKYGYMYFKTDANKTVLSRWHNCSLELNEKYQGYVVVPDDKPLDKSYGIIGYDVAFNQMPFVDFLVPGKWDDRLNPRIEPNGTVTFQKCSIKVDVYDRAIQMLQKKDAFLNAYPRTIHFSSQLKRQQDLIDMVQSSKYTTGLISWDSHARFFFKDDKLKIVYIYDPWKQKAGGSRHYIEINQIIKDQGYTTKFVARGTKDQGNEGSCLASAMVRVIMISLEGQSGATDAIDFNCVLLTSRAISKVR